MNHVDQGFSNFLMPKYDAMGLSSENVFIAFVFKCTKGYLYLENNLFSVIK